MLNLKIKGEIPSVASLEAALGNKKDIIDLDFGVIEVDSENRVFAILIEESEVESAQKAFDENIQVLHTSGAIKISTFE